MRALLIVVVVAGLLQGASAKAESGRQVFVANHAESEPYMWTLTKDTFFGGLAGALLGGAVLLVSGFEADPMLVAYCAGGGMMAGAGFGVWEVVDRRNQVRGPSAMLERPAPSRLLVWTVRF